MTTCSALRPSSSVAPGRSSGSYEKRALRGRLLHFCSPSPRLPPAASSCSSSASKWPWPPSWFPTSSSPVDDDAPRNCLARALAAPSLSQSAPLVQSPAGKQKSSLIFCGRNDGARPSTLLSPLLLLVPPMGRRYRARVQQSGSRAPTSKWTSVGADRTWTSPEGRSEKGRGRHNCDVEEGTAPRGGAKTEDGDGRGRDASSTATSSRRRRRLDFRLRPPPGMGIAALPPFSRTSTLSPPALSSSSPLPRRDFGSGPAVIAALRCRATSSSFPARGMSDVSPHRPVPPPPPHSSSAAILAPSLSSSVPLAPLPLADLPHPRSALVTNTASRGEHSSNSASLRISSCFRMTSSSVALGKPTSVRMGRRRRTWERTGTWLGNADEACSIGSRGRYPPRVWRRRARRRRARRRFFRWRRASGSSPAAAFVPLEFAASSSLELEVGPPSSRHAHPSNGSLSSDTPGLHANCRTLGHACSCANTSACVIDGDILLCRFSKDDLLLPTSLAVLLRSLLSAASTSSSLVGGGIRSNATRFRTSSGRI
mmetsp:Transcript_17883/g.51892  ORF Transcript_17883/g.51892 Transcript_17883/m.51892 type:complete len:540 (-) Transcript_17883:40-1659(-)